MTGYQVRNLAFAYGEKTVLHDLSFDLRPGRFYGIIGPNGCGKSTLVDLLSGSRVPDAGRIVFADRELKTYSRKTLAREVALVPQNFYIDFPFTAGEIVMMGRYPFLSRFAAPSDKDHELVRQTMALTETSGFTRRYVTELSGGERQRVVFARALVQETPVLILDEATSNLDINHALRLLDIAAGRAAAGGLVVAVMQDINLAAAFCHELIFLKEGRLAAFGKTQTVLTTDTLRSVFEVESKVYFEPYNQSRQAVFKHQRKRCPQRVAGTGRARV